MVILNSELNKYIKAFEKSNYLEKQSKGTGFQHSQQPLWLQAILESWVDGVLVLTKQGEWVYANKCASRICNQLSQGNLSNTVPLVIWRACESLIERRELVPAAKLMVESEIGTANSSLFRIRVQWLVLEESACAYLLVIIEDQEQSRKNAAIATAKKYNLTPP